MPSSTSRLSARLALAAMLTLPLGALLGVSIVVAPPHSVHESWSDSASRAAYPDVPIVAHTGGFGEPTCQTCHFDSPLNSAGGELEVQGWPDHAEPGSTHRLLVSVRHPELARGGFQLSVRDKDGGQAGSLEPTDERSLVVESPAGIAYAQHTLEGTAPAGDRVATWEIVWTAPERQTAVRLHIAANAANGDDSEFGDYIYADSLASRVK